MSLSLLLNQCLTLRICLLRYPVTSIGQKSTYVKVIGRYHSMETKHMTAFQTTRGLFQFKVLPFGMVNSEASFSRMMRKVLKGLQNVDNFVDDILIFTDTFSQHVKVFDQVLNRFAGARLISKPSACFIGYRQLECLGHTIGQGKLLPGTDKIEVVK